jgi:hypothetical protein
MMTSVIGALQTSAELRSGTVRPRWAVSEPPGRAALRPAPDRDTPPMFGAYPRAQCPAKRQPLGTSSGAQISSTRMTIRSHQLGEAEHYRRNREPAIHRLALPGRTCYLI